MTYTCWAGYLSDHTFEDDEVGCTWREAKFSVLDALSDEGSHAQCEADTVNDERERDEWLHWEEIYRVAISILEQTPAYSTFDVNIRDERYAIVPE